MRYWLITGGAGYIGSHIVRDFLSAGTPILVLDNLSTGIKKRIPEGTPFLEVDLKEKHNIEQIFIKFPIEGVIHLAAKKSVIESMTKPFFYHEENTKSLLNLLEVMKVNRVNKIVYSSSSSVYGMQKNNFAKESDELHPISVYGQTKLIGEWLLQAATEWGLKSFALRYFNVAGSGSTLLQDYGEHNLIPMVFKAITKGQNPYIFGNDYQTRDGTCIRDFIHVDDVASAHLMFSRLFDKNSGFNVFNIGTGKGSSVKEVIEKIRHITGLNFDIEVKKRRDGDPPITGADISKISENTNWQAKKNLDDMVQSAWNAWNQRDDI